MPNPKRRHSKSRKGLRRANYHLKAPAVQRDPRTGLARLSHRLLETDTHYGFTKGGEGGFEVRERRDF
jgi:ribosomal protein L32